MKFQRVWVFALIAATAVSLAPEPSSAASKEIQDLQREVALLGEAIKQMQANQDKNFTALTVLTQQALDAANRANTAVAVIQNGFERSTQAQQDKVVAPVVGLSTRMDNLSSDVRTVTQAISDLTAQMARIQSQLTDLNNAVKVLSTPPVAAPPQPNDRPAPPIGGTGGQMPAATAQMPPMTATQLWAAASHDRQGGNMELALSGFQDFLKYYGNTEQAPEAQFYIGQIHYSQHDYEAAAQDFDMVLEKYSENAKTRAAMYYKGLSLAQAGHKTQGADEYRQLIGNYPNTDEAKMACSQLTSMGFHCPSPAASAPKGGAGKKKRG
jgi:TolA-binding protein